MRCGRGWTVAALSILGAGLLLGAATQATGGTGGIVVWATGLNNPRGLAFGPDGSLYVAEAGRSGRLCQGRGENRSCGGFTGSVTRLHEGARVRVAGGLLSGGSPEGAFAGGAHDVAIGPDGLAYVVMGSVGPNARRFGARVAAQSGQLLRLGPGGTKVSVASVESYEYRHNPDRSDRFSNPYSVTFAPGGAAVVVDAGANALLSVAPGGRVFTIATFPARFFRGRGVQSVPTSVTVGPDGAFYVGELGGDGTPPRQARVWRVVPGQRPTVYARGFDTIVDVAFGPDGSLYVVELLRNGFAQFERMDPTGALFRIRPDGRRSELARGQLRFPGGVAVDREGRVYVTTNSVFPRAGRVLQLTAGTSFAE